MDLSWRTFAGHWSAYAQIAFLVISGFMLYLYQVHAPIEIILNVGRLQLGVALVMAVGVWQRHA